MNKKYEINQMRVLPETGEAVIVSFSLEFSDDRYPGVVSIHGGTIPIEGLTRDSSVAETTAALENALASQMPSLEIFHERQLRFQHMMENTEIVDLKRSDPTPADVINERTRRLAEGFDFNFGDARGIHRIATTEHDMNNWQEVTSWMQAKLALGETSSYITIMTNTGPVQVTPLDWAKILDAATAFRQPIWQASFVLQSLAPIPRDYATNDLYWQ